MRISDGVYQPRSVWRDYHERLAGIRQAVKRWLRLAFLRLAGAAVVLGTSVLALALLTYHASDPSLDYASGGAARNLFGIPGATAADMFLQYFGLGVVAVLVPLMAWGLRAMQARPLSYATVRLIAWPLGVLFLAGGLGVLPPFDVLPAGPGGILGIAAGRYAAHLGAITAQGWLPLALLPLLMVLGLVLMFLAADWRPRWQRKSALVRRVEDFNADAGDDESDDAADVEPTDGGGAGEDVDEDVAEEDGAPPERPADDSPEDFAPPRVRTGYAAPPPRARKQPSLGLDDGYQFPPLDLLAEPVHEKKASQSEAALAENARQLVTVLADFGVKGRIREVRAGPVVTLYEFEPAAGIKSSRIIALADDIARSMSAVAARVAVIPGRNVLGIELPNEDRETVFLRELLAADAFTGARAPLILALGKTIGGEAVMTDLAKMPHLLIAGTTGSGKSVAINTMILSLLYRLTPQQCRMIMVDPKMLELSVYDGIPHLLTPVVTDPKKAVVALKWAVREMEERYRKMSKLGVRGIEAFNERVKKASAKGEVLKRTVQTGFDRETGKPIYEDETLELEPMPYIVVIVDEMADLMMVAGKDIEGAVQRLAQMARAAGLHLITATQRPSVDVITGTIKANFPTRISFQVTSKVDSRTILGEQGAEQLLGRGDMLYMMAGGRIKRVHGPFVADEEVEEVVRFLKTQGSPDYLSEVTEDADEDGGGGEAGGFAEGGDSGDDLYDKALDIVARERRVSTSYIQRRLQIGYNRAARLVERMEMEGVVSKPNHKGKREILLPDHRGEYPEE